MRDKIYVDYWADERNRTEFYCGNVDVRADATVAQCEVCILRCLISNGTFAFDKNHLNLSVALVSSWMRVWSPATAIAFRRVRTKKNENARVHFFDCLTYGCVAVEYLQLLSRVSWKYYLDILRIYCIDRV